MVKFLASLISPLSLMFLVAIFLNLITYSKFWWWTAASFGMAIWVIIIIKALSRERNCD